MLRRLSVPALVALVALLASACNYAYGPFLTRVDGPVVLTGADLNIVGFGLDPDRGLAYRWDDGAGEWVQIPVQVDERTTVDFGSVPANNTAAGVTGTIYGSGSTIGVTVDVYADPGTWVGADPDASIDADDEIVVLSRDAGPQAPAGTAPPAGTVGGVGREVELVDPDGGTPGYVYFFYGAAGADPSAGQDHVDYTFSLDGGTYLDDYKRGDGPNPESSTVVTDNYTMGFSDRWFTDELRSNWGSGVDILDGHKSQFALTSCGRSNATFADAHGAFVANIDGPVRAIRSYVGANSGPLTQRTEIFYEDRYEQITDLRVHAIPGVMSFWDWSAAAVGMDYGSSTLASPVTIDGSPDSVPTTRPVWEYIEGPPGDLATVGVFTSSFSPTVEQVYVDDDTPPYTECWGDDGDFIGAAGQAVVSGLPDTDPRSATFDTFQSRQVTSVWPASVDMASWTPVWAAQALQDLDATVTSY